MLRKLGGGEGVLGAGGLVFGSDGGADRAGGDEILWPGTTTGNPGLPADGAGRARGRHWRALGRRNRQVTNEPS